MIQKSLLSRSKIDITTGCIVIVVLSLKMLGVRRHDPEVVNALALPEPRPSAILSQIPDVNIHCLEFEAASITFAGHITRKIARKGTHVDRLLGKEGPNDKEADRDISSSKIRLKCHCLSRTRFLRALCDGSELSEIEPEVALLYDDVLINPSKSDRSQALGCSAVSFEVLWSHTSDTSAI